MGKEDYIAKEYIEKIVKDYEHKYQKEGYFFICDEKSERLLMLIFWNRSVKEIEGIYHG